MLSFLVKNLIFLSFLASCSPQKPTVSEETVTDVETNQKGTSLSMASIPGNTSITNQSEVMTNQDGQLLRADSRTKKVSAFDLDEAQFAIQYLTASSQNYLNSETIILTFERPIDSDYVEILRCRSDVVINTGIILVDFKDWELNGMSEEEKLNLYSSGDLFTMALEEEGCAYLNEASLEESVPDAWAPSGSYRYLAVSCVAPNRLTDTDVYSKRNCSRRFALSPIVHYTNQRKEDEKAALHDLETVRSGLDLVASTLGEQAFTLIEAMDACEQREYNRGVDTNLKNSVLQVVGMALEMAIEMTDFVKEQGVFKKAVQGISKSGAKGAASGAAEEAAAKAGKNFDEAGDQLGRKASKAAGVDKEKGPGFVQTMMNSIQLGQAFEGMTPTMILVNLNYRASDMPRSCSEVLSLNETLGVTLEQMYILAQKTVYFETVVDQVRKGMSDQAGLSTDEINLDPLNPSNTSKTDSSSGASSGGLYED